jgi:hypothetical protein
MSYLDIGMGRGDPGGGLALAFDGLAIWFGEVGVVVNVD